MVANKEKLRSYLESENLTAQDFARRLRVEQSEADKLLAGERVGYDTARNRPCKSKSNGCSTKCTRTCTT